MEQVNITLDWPGRDEVPILFANQIIAQVNSGEVFLTFGQVAPPAVLGTPAEQRQQVEEIKAMGSIPVRTVARLSMTPAKLLDLVRILNEVVEKHEIQQRLEAAQREASGD
jgi:hypothetical protein